MKSVTLLCSSMLLASHSIAAELPRFTDFPAQCYTINRPARVNLSSNPLARRYRTRLRLGAATGPNFAGHYTVVEWGCGSACASCGVVDARTGTVFGDDTMNGAKTGYAYRRDSNLFIVNPVEDSLRFHFGDTLLTSYYLWNGRTFKFLRTHQDPRVEYFR